MRSSESKSHQPRAFVTGILFLFFHHCNNSLFQSFDFRKPRLNSFNPKEIFCCCFPYRPEPNSYFLSLLAITYLQSIAPLHFSPSSLFHSFHPTLLSASTFILDRLFNIPRLTFALYYHRDVETGSQVRYNPPRLQYAHEHYASNPQDEGNPSTNISDDHDEEDCK